MNQNTHTTLLSLFKVSSVGNLLQLFFMTNAYIRLEQMSVKASRGIFLLWGLKNYCLLNVAKKGIYDCKK